jgi:UDPglucose--hexose-1-phosphate uridylyltransferase
MNGFWFLHRSKRPWQGQNETIHSDALPEYDTTCYLCPGNVREWNGESRL